MVLAEQAGISKSLYRYWYEQVIFGEIEVERMLLNIEENLGDSDMIAIIETMRENLG